MIEATNALKESAEWELHALVEKEPEMFERVVSKQVENIATEMKELQTEAERLKQEIEELSGDAGTSLG